VFPSALCDMLDFTTAEVGERLPKLENSGCSDFLYYLYKKTKTQQEDLLDVTADMQLPKYQRHSGTRGATMAEECTNACKDWEHGP
jgi:hypothetical protein